MKISVIIVSYNARYYLEQCLYSVEESLKNYEAEIIVVDNHSPEKPISFLKEKFPTVQFLELTDNLGFAKANNVGVELAKGEFILILNPDTVVPENLFSEILPFAEKQKDLGALGVRLVDANGRFHPESKRNVPDLKNSFGKLFGSFLSKKHTQGYYQSEVNEFDISAVDVLVGAFMLMKRDVYQQVGGFDPRYFMYGEDIDLSYTLLRRGFVNYYYGKTTIIHYKGESTRKDRKYLKIFFEAMDHFVEKYYKQDFFQYIIFMTGLFIRSNWAIIQGQFKGKDKNSKKIIPLEISKLQRIKTSSEIYPDFTKILLDGNIFSHQEMIEMIVENQNSNRQFYIQPRNMSVVIGDMGVYPV